jgi:hypothetical protein
MILSGAVVWADPPRDGKPAKDAKDKVVVESDPGTVEGLRGQNGKVYLFEVTGTTRGSVWGTGVYTDDSTLAAAAVHAGVLKDGQTGVVKVTILPGLKAYQGSKRNGVTTQKWDAHAGSFRVEAARGVAVKGPTEDTPRRDPETLVKLRGQNGKVFFFEVTGTTNGTVWGSGVYTDDSTLAAAAVHAGALKDGEKGIVKVTILPGEASYTGSERNGVTTQKWDAHPGSFRVEAVKKKEPPKP